MKKKMMTLFMILGFIVMIYPLIMDMYYNQQQKRLLEDWQQINDNIENENLQVENDTLGEMEYEMMELIRTSTESSTEEVDRGAKVATETQELEKEKLEREKREKRANYLKANMEGTLKIEKIDFHQPILSGATKQNLDISISSMKNSGKPGEDGNYVIAGHRSHTYGRNFNRLDEVSIGDLLVVETDKETFNYRVVEKFLVNPDETWVLKRDKGVKEITLITCDPMINPNKRLIIKGQILK
ncbi:class D sortase [Alkaliphilus hydrothermalis]|uniref:Sortase A n=1 Tax=Alkaliphilus hydrothermalis TaxID=1482730 RepID=A0ABS2NS21_9FIRM|nr:class D sortase [Alkaliphilus hydrothermalis]MBM7615753.1 sortase A [Alkaliphilus hydrothermalis]